MARQLRIQYPGAIYHVTVRGNARQNIFKDDKDRYLLYARLAESSDIYAVRIYLFCLMGNHFHLVLETPRANLSRFMQSALTGYTVCYNLRHNCHGHLTQGRYSAKLVSGDEYLLKLSRYVHLNPVNMQDHVDLPIAERKARLREYPWSSYPSYIGQAKRLEWVDYDPMLALVGEVAKHRPASYQRFVESGMAVDYDFIEVLKGSARSIGDDDFREWVDECYSELLAKRKHPEDVALRRETMCGAAPEFVLGKVASAAGVTVEELKSRRQGGIWKGIAAKLLVTLSGMTRRECAKWLGVQSGAAVGYQIKRANIVLSSDIKLARKVVRLESQLMKD